MSKIQIVVNGHVDRKIIQDALFSGSYQIEVLNNFRPDKDPEYSIDLNDLSGDDQEAFCAAIDVATNAIEADALIWKITKSGKLFSLESSFVRDSVSTESTTDIPDGTPLKMKFEVSAFVANVFREIDVWYNEDFNPADLDALAEIGITLTGNGAKFTVANTSDCMLSFSKPAGASEMYVIEYDFKDEIIVV